MFRANKNIKPKMSTSSSPSILNLNDDCLYTILAYLPLPDLCSIGATCPRLNEIACQFYGRFAHLSATHFVNAQNSVLPTKQKMEMIIKQVALYVTSFQLPDAFKMANNSVMCETLIRLILSHCQNITALNFRFDFDDRFGREISKLKNFHKLETLDVNGGNIEMKNLTKLKNLHLTGLANGGKTNLLKLKSLESLCLNIGMNMDSVFFSQICDNNPGIKQIKLFWVKTIILDIIVDKLAQLEDCTLHWRMTDVTNIHRISEIKNLKKFSSTNSVPNLLAKLVKLDQLESLKYYPTPSETDLITEFTKLKVLCTSNLNEVHLASLKSLHTLEHLSLELAHSDDVTNKGVAHFVSGATNLRYLKLKKYFICDKLLLEMLSDLYRKRSSKLTVELDFLSNEELINCPQLKIIVKPPTIIPPKDVPQKIRIPNTPCELQRRSTHWYFRWNQHLNK